LLGRTRAARCLLARTTPRHARGSNEH
jgi:hypothetical protein